MFRPIGIDKACFFASDREPGLAEFLTQEFGQIPVTIKSEGITRLEKWYVRNGNSLPVKGPLGILIHQMKKFSGV